MNKHWQLPLYQSHKKIRAAKIIAIETEPTGDKHTLHLLDADNVRHRVTVDHQYMGKHRPSTGGYFVAYEDGYESYSPAEAFEAGNTLVPDLQPISPQKLADLGLNEAIAHAMRPDAVFGGVDIDAVHAKRLTSKILDPAMTDAFIEASKQVISTGTATLRTELAINDAGEIAGIKTMNVKFPDNPFPSKDGGS